MIDVKEERAELARIDEMRVGDVGANLRLRQVAVRALDELEALRKQVAPCRFDVAAAREELARIDAAWFDAGSPKSEQHAFHAARALLDRALAAIDAEWPEPAAITDAVVEEAAKIAWRTDGTSIGEFHKAGALRESYLREARAVLEYAASLGGVAAAPVTEASRPFRQTPDMPQLAVLAACARSGCSERVTIDHLAEEVARLESIIARGYELTATPRMSIPVATQADFDRWANLRRSPQPPSGKSTADRLTDYRCAVSIAHPEWDPTDVEEHAHAMLAAEKEPTRG